MRPRPPNSETGHRPRWYVFGGVLIVVGVLVFLLPLEFVTRDYVAGALTGAGVAILTTEATSVDDRRRRVREHRELLRSNDDLQAEVRRLSSGVSSTMHEVVTEVSNRKAERQLQDKRAFSVGLFLYLVGTGTPATYEELLGKVMDLSSPHDKGQWLWLGIRDRLAELGVRLDANQRDSLRALRDAFVEDVEAGDGPTDRKEPARTPGIGPNGEFVPPTSSVVTHQVEGLLRPEHLPLFRLGMALGMLSAIAIRDGRGLDEPEVFGRLRESYRQIEEIESKLGRDALFGRFAATQMREGIKLALVSFTPAERRMEALGGIGKVVSNLNSDTRFGEVVAHHSWLPGGKSDSP